MSTRKIKFANKEFYHIYNRGVDKREVFLDERDYDRFLLAVILLNDEQDALLDKWRDLRKCNSKITLSNFRRLNLRKPLVDIIAFCFNPNHYHFILRQVREKGIEKFMHRLGTAYTMFFNKKYKRTGALFQGSFKSIYIDSNDYLLYLSAYVNKNYFIHGYKGANWKHSSLSEYKNKNNKLGRINNVCKPASILRQFKNPADYIKFLNENAVYLKNKKETQKYLLEE